MNDKFSQYPGPILREGRLGLFTPSPFLPVHFHWTTTNRLRSGWEVVSIIIVTEDKRQLLIRLSMREDRTRFVLISRF